MPTQNIFTASLFEPEEFTITYELVPGQGSGGRRVEKLLEFAAQAGQDGRIKALSITDNPGGHPALAPIAIGSEIRKTGIEPLLHFSLKDKNRSQIESHLFLYHRQNFNNLLVMGGDFPRISYHGQALPVFDLDSVQTLQLMRDMEEGTYRSGFKNARPAFDPITFNRGCVVSPFKMTESEQVWQYAKFLQKKRAGAHFVVTQLGYDICKFEEFIRFLRESGITIPVLGNVFIPSLAVARYMGKGQVPGIVFPEQLILQMEQEEASGSREARLVRAAKLICVLKGLGYSGVHLGGNGLSFDNVKFILDTSEELGTNWDMLRRDVHFPVPDTWYLYPPARTGACGKDKTSLTPGRKNAAQRPHRLTHKMFFSPPNITSRLFGKICLYCAKSRRRTAMLRIFERWIKGLLFYCRMCGDCTLAESTYICPQSGCPKKLLNGPCGGSRNQACEVFPDRFCFWVREYNREDPDATIEKLGSLPFMHPKNWALDQTSSWINFYNGTDHNRISFDKDSH
ncbi:MAG TPA: methylenetetrahydrofolate reductase [Desulfobacteraceae bacterium]|nr:methylenetetrahydrofolate reductase [Desulfobacteraceae bacterium]